MLKLAVDFDFMRDWLQTTEQSGSMQRIARAVTTRIKGTYCVWGGDGGVGDGDGDGAILACLLRCCYFGLDGKIKEERAAQRSSRFDDLLRSK
ncbi:hypothetical protein V1478_008951 [Vespula squamosa]|uniref:Uncharacterized protein n=1 Tax=Vespula squamosa TaxID=30214 RepID=A0ABD2AV01_VESSQ